MFYIGTLFKVRFTQDSGLGRCVLSSFFEGLDARVVKVVDILTTSLTPLKWLHTPIFLHEFSFLCDLPYHCNTGLSILNTRSFVLSGHFSFLPRMTIEYKIHCVTIFIPYKFYTNRKILELKFCVFNTTLNNTVKSRLKSDC
jgi:hypothetical protein